MTLVKHKGQQGRRVGVKKRRKVKEKKLKNTFELLKRIVKR